jgi:hypothetical protein
METDRLTQKSQEALHDAQTRALRLGHTEVDGEHLLAALLDQPDGLAPAWSRPRAPTSPGSRPPSSGSSAAAPSSAAREPRPARCS